MVTVLYFVQVYIEFCNLLCIQQYNRVAISGGDHDFMLFFVRFVLIHIPPNVLSDYTAQNSGDQRMSAWFQLLYFV